MKDPFEALDDFFDCEVKVRIWQTVFVVAVLLVIARCAVGWN